MFWMTYKHPCCNWQMSARHLHCQTSKFSISLISKTKLHLTYLSLQCYDKAHWERCHCNNNSWAVAAVPIWFRSFFNLEKTLRTTSASQGNSFDDSFLNSKRWPTSVTTTAIMYWNVSLQINMSRQKNTQWIVGQPLCSATRWWKWGRIHPNLPIFYGRPPQLPTAFLSPYRPDPKGLVRHSTRNKSASWQRLGAYRQASGIVTWWDKCNS